MGLINLISNLDSSTKTTMLGEKITQILRYTFVENDFYAVEQGIVDEALAIQKGAILVKKNKEILLESVRLTHLNTLGFKNHNEAIEYYTKNPQHFIDHFNIEEEYLIEAPTDNRENFEFQSPKHGECNGVNAFPHDYQQRLRKEILLKFFNQLNPVILASMPTGAGKTVLAMEIIVDLLRSYRHLKSKEVNIIWVVASKELTEQSLRSFQKLWKQKGDEAVITERYFGRFNSIHFTNKSKITFATFDLLVSRSNQKDVQELFSMGDFLFIDEAHGSEATTYSNVIETYRRLNPDYKILGLTATPYRSDDNEFRSLKNLFTDYLVLTDNLGERVESPLQYLIERQFLSEIDFEILDISEGEISRSEYYRTLHNAVLKECRLLISKRQNTIIFAESKAHAVALSIFLKRNSIDNGLIVGETSEVKRAEYLNNFADIEHPLSVLVNHQILSTGIDVPGMNSIIILSDIISPTLALQVLGRAMRGPKNGGNKRNTIYLTPSNEKRLSNYKILESIVLK